jgi:hypothetical protein
MANSRRHTEEARTKYLCQGKVGWTTMTVPTINHPPSLYVAQPNRRPVHTPTSQKPRRTRPHPSSTQTAAWSENSLAPRTSKYVLESLAIERAWLSALLSALVIELSHPPNSPLVWIEKNFSNATEFSLHSRQPLSIYASVILQYMSFKSQVSRTATRHYRAESSDTNREETSSGMLETTTWSNWPRC